jgi:hypothetical protein
MTEGVAAAVRSDELVVGCSEVRRLEEGIRDLERLLGRKTLNIEILREALAKSESKNQACGSCRSRRAVPIKAVGDTLGIALSHLHDKVDSASKPRRPYRKAEDGELLPLIRRLVDERRTYGFRRSTALANRELASTGEPAVNHCACSASCGRTGCCSPGTPVAGLAAFTTERRGGGHALEPALVVGRLRDHLLER